MFEFLEGERPPQQVFAGQQYKPVKVAFLPLGNAAAGC